MSSSTSSSEIPAVQAASGAPAVARPARAVTTKASARTFLASIAGGAAAAVAMFSFMPESFLHAGPEYGMAEAHQDMMAAACARQSAPDMLILGDSRAVAGLSVRDLRAAGIDAEKYALSASGLLSGWAFLDRMTECGVKPKNVVLAYGLVHLVDTGAVMDRTTSFDGLRGPRAGAEYRAFADAEDRTGRKLAYRAASLVGTELSGLDFALLMPSIRNVLARPGQALQNHRWFEMERASFQANAGDRYYGLDHSATALPQEQEKAGQGIPAMNLKALELIQATARRHGVRVWFYAMPMSELSAAGLDATVLNNGRELISEMPRYGITPLNGLWSLPDDQFGDESHVNPKGRASVTADFLPRWPREGERTRTAGLTH